MTRKNTTPAIPDTYPTEQCEGDAWQAAKNRTDWAMIVSTNLTPPFKPERMGEAVCVACLTRPHGYHHVIDAAVYYRADRRRYYTNLYFRKDGEPPAHLIDREYRDFGRALAALVQGIKCHAAKFQRQVPINTAAYNKLIAELDASHAKFMAEYSAKNQTA